MKSQKNYFRWLSASTCRPSRIAIGVVSISTKNSFALIQERFRERLVFIFAFMNGEPIGGTVNVTKGDALYGRYWGATRSVRFMHFNVCYYAAVDYCITHGLQRFEPGAGGDYKQMRGFDAQPTYSAHFVADPRLADAVAQFLESERANAAESIEWLTEHSALKR